MDKAQSCFLLAAIYTAPHLDKQFAVELGLILAVAGMVFYWWYKD